MKRNIVIPMFSLLMLSACIVAPTHGGGLQIVPMLPTVVEIDSDNYYSHGGYHYFYTDQRWYYSDSRNGHQSELPQSHWPQETRRRGENHGGERRSENHGEDRH